MVIQSGRNEPHPLPYAVVRVSDGSVAARFEREAEASAALPQLEELEKVSLVVRTRP
jgi:hypothetical protein